MTLKMPLSGWVRTLWASAPLTPSPPADLRKQNIVPTFDEEIFKRNREGDGRDWHTIESPFWLQEEQWQYVMYGVIKYKGEYYAVYHGRDIKAAANDGYVEARTARICKLLVNDGKITAQRI